MKLTWYGHSAFRVEAGAAKILIDPFQSDNSPWDKGWIGCRRGLDTGSRTMKAIVVTDQAAGTAGMTMVERCDPQAAMNDVVVQVHASGFTPRELAWPSTWTDRLGRDQTPSIPGHEQAGVVSALGYGTRGLSVGQRVFGLTDCIATAPRRSMRPSWRATSRRCRATSTSRWARACRSQA